MGQDWRPISAEQIVANLDRGLVRSRRRHAGANMLLHDGSDVAMGADRTQTLCATELLLERFKRDGSRVVTVDAWT